MCALSGRESGMGMAFLAITHSLPIASLSWSYVMSPRRRVYSHFSHMVLELHSSLRLS